MTVSSLAKDWITVQFLRLLFQKVDNTRQEHPDIFHMAGRRRMRRVLDSQTVARKPPPNLSPVFFRPEYLEAKQVSEVNLGKEERPVSRCT